MSKNLSVSLTKRDSGRRYYNVTRNGIPYAVVHNVISDDWNIHNVYGTKLSMHGAVGMSLICACEKYFKELENV